jgi:hypothetical protein
MPTIKQIKDKVDIARKGIEQETAKIILQFEQQILDLVRENQLYDKGIDGKGQELQEYKKITKILKFGKNQKISNTTLKDTGAFYRSFQTDYGSFELEIFATDTKTSKITTKYGDNLFILTPDSDDKLSSEIIRPNLIKYFNTIFK